jgi:hypothetical protein
MLTRSGPFRYHREKWRPSSFYVFPAVVVVMERKPRYWRVEFRWLVYGLDWEWWPKEGK